MARFNNSCDYFSNCEIDNIDVLESLSKLEYLDLLGTKYNIANQNIPAELVDKIQLLNNHQAIRALDSFTTNKGTAINIKLNQLLLLQVPLLKN